MSIKAHMRFFLAEPSDMPFALHVYISMFASRNVHGGRPPADQMMLAVFGDDAICSGRAVSQCKLEPHFPICGIMGACTKSANVARCRDSEQLCRKTNWVIVRPLLDWQLMREKKIPGLTFANVLSRF